MKGARGVSPKTTISDIWLYMVQVASKIIWQIACLSLSVLFANETKWSKNEKVVDLRNIRNPKGGS
jgi:hypothetical protein